jgi:hypothetical protein
MKYITMLALLMLMFASHAESQVVKELSSGMRIRVTETSGAKAVGKLVRVSSDTIELRSSKSATGRAAFERKNLQRIEVSSSRRRGAGALKYGMLGMLGAGAAGALLGYGLGDENGWFDRGDTAMMFGFALGSVGLGIGVVAGAIEGAEQWVPVSPRN